MKVQWPSLRSALAVLGLTVVVISGGLVAPGGGLFVDGGALAQQVPALPPESAAQRTPAGAPESAQERLAPLGFSSDSDIWREVRLGIQGQVPIPDVQAGVLVQSEGDNWRSIRNGPLVTYGWWLLAATIAVLALFFALRGRIRIDAGPAGTTIERFTAFERFVHWLIAGSFIVLALTGLNMLYGRYFFAMDPAGDVGNFTAAHKAFAAVTYYGKFVHSYIGFAFGVGVVLMIIIWIRHNILDKYDFVWLAKGGGMFMSGVHPPARKFNFGQKVIFWVVALAGISVTWSGISLIFPFELSPFAETFAVLNLFGAGLPTELTAMQEMQLAQISHAGVALIFIAVIIAHIYIGTLGMEGAFDAMYSGRVDTNWAREHHSVWVAELEGTPDSGSGGGDAPGGAEQPAE